MNSILPSFFIFLGVSFLPVYTFSSGGMQPSHIFLSLFFVLVFLIKGFRVDFFSALLFVLVEYVFFVEGFYAIAGGGYSYLINGFFFLYNLFLYMALRSYIDNHGPVIIFWGVTVAGLLAFVAVLYQGVGLNVGSDAGRSVGFFNNPNQLGYFSVCFLSLSYIFYREALVGFFQSLLLYFVAIFLSVSSLSKAAMIANFLVVAIALIPSETNGVKISASRKVLMMFFWFLSIFAVLFIAVLFLASGAGQNYIFVNRIQGMADESDSSLSSRGYFAFLEGDGLQIIMGLGSGFVQNIVGHEVHSTIASVMNSYGLVGLFVFLWLLLFWYIKVYRAYGFSGAVSICGPAMLYGITHNGTRFVIFWLLFSLSIALSERRLRFG